MYGKPSKEDLALFNMELANLVRSGLPLSDGMKHIAREVRSPQFQRDISAVQVRLDQGVSLSEAMAASPAAFSPYYLSLIRAGEESGNLSDVLFHLTRYARFQHRARSKIIGGMAYPVLQFAIAIVIFIVILWYIVPRFKEMYEAAGAELPGLTQLFVNMSGLIRFHTGEVLLFILVLSLIAYITSKYIFRTAVDWLKLRLPVMGKPMRLGLLIHYCEVVGQMLRRNLPIVDSLRLAATTTGNQHASRSFERLADGVERGTPLSEEMRQVKLFPHSLVWMTATAEKQERLDEVLMEASELYMNQLEDWCDRVGWIVQPLFIVLCGLLIGIAVIALYMPLFKIGDVIK